MMGYLERLSFYLEKQDFCNKAQFDIWPPLEALRPVVGPDSVSCVATCSGEGNLNVNAFSRIYSIRYTKIGNISHLLAQTGLLYCTIGQGLGKKKNFNNLSG